MKIPWSFKDCIKSISLIVIIILVINGISFLLKDNILSLKQLIPNNYKSYIILTLFLIQEIIFILSIYLFLKKYNNNFLELLKYFKFNKIGFKNNIKAILTGYLLFIFINIIFLYIKQYIEIPGYGTQNVPLPIIKNSYIDIIITYIIVVFIGPLIEEIYFRGYILQGSIKSFGIIYGSIITSIIFTLIHLDLNVIIPIFIMSNIMNYLFIKYNSIYPSLFLHMINNFISLTILLNS